ncbi:Uncharacterized protein SCF082_LOCUS35511, partial [Durusdinium trenchii]
DAFYLIAVAYDLDGNGLLDEDEVLLILDRCQLLDETLTPTKIRSFFRTWLAGCNTIIGENMGAEEIEDGIGYEEFLSLIFWIADMKVLQERSRVDGYEFTSLCHAPLQHVVFQCFIAVSSSAKTTNLYVPEVFSAGDAFKIFYETPGLVNQRMDFGGFMHAICEVGLLFGKNQKEAGEMFAAAVGRMDTDQETIRRVKLRIKQACCNVLLGWREFFHECDLDQSGYMDIDEPLGLSLGPNNIIAPVYCSAFDRFFDMCRHKLKMEVQSSEQIGGSADRRIG